MPRALPASPRAALLVGLLLAGTLLSGCWVSKDAGAAMQRDIGQLKGDVTSVREGVDQQRGQLQEQLQRGDAKIDEVDRKLQDLNRAARKTDAGFGVRMDELQRDLQELRGQNEHLAYRLAQIEQKLEGTEALGRRVDALENATPASPMIAEAPREGGDKDRDKKDKGDKGDKGDKDKGDKDKGDKGDKDKGDKGDKDKGDKAEPMPKDKAGLLARGSQLVQQNQLEEARGVLREVTKRWPKELGAADEAYFQIGETYFKESKFRPALQEYIHIVEEYPKGKLVANAYYRIGQCSMELGNLEDAVIFFDVILKDHKDHPVAKQAKKMRAEAAKRLDKEKKG